MPLLVMKMPSVATLCGHVSLDEIVTDVMVKAHWTMPLENRQAVPSKSSVTPSSEPGVEDDAPVSGPNKQTLLAFVAADDKGDGGCSVSNWVAVGVGVGRECCDHA